jgi:hypothetical protein
MVFFDSASASVRGPRQDSMSAPRPKRDCAASLSLIEVCFSLINSLAVNKGRDNLIAESLLLLLKVIYICVSTI